MRSIYFCKVATQTQITLRDAKGAFRDRAASRFVKESDFSDLAERFGISADFIRQSFDTFEQGGTDTFYLDDPLAIVWLQGIRDDRVTSFKAQSLIEAFTVALDFEDPTFNEPIIRWDDIATLAALDLDPSEGFEFTEESLLDLGGVPVPLFSWVTKSGGLRLVYTAEPPYTAEEVAAVAYLSLYQRIPHRSIEIKHDTRHPKYPSHDGTRCGMIHVRQQKFDTTQLRRWLKLYNVSDDEVQAWLTERGMVVGGRYDHDMCPIDPSHVSRGAAPVFVGEDGIFCHSCCGRGVSKGSRQPGSFPYSALCGTSGSTMIYRCMQNACHWEHARYILENKMDLIGHYAEIVYAAGMLLHGHNRKMVDIAMAAGKDFIRMNDCWTNLQGKVYNKEIKPIVSKLPACNVAKGEKMVPDPEKVSKFLQNHDLSSYGYPSILPIYGTRIWRIKGESREVSAVIQTRQLSDDSMFKFRPQYLPLERRSMSTEQAWALVEEVFPGISRNYVKLLITARGIIEGGRSMTPLLFVTGPTGTGKSMSVHVAAAICGDANTESVWNVNTDRMRQSIMDASGSYVTFNEPNKEAKQQKRGGQNSTEALDFILNLTPDSTSHYMYQGPVRLGRLPVIVFTDTDLPLRVKQDAQLSRRITHVPLLKPIDWEQSLKNSGIGDAKNFRVASEANAEAGNVILSELIDEFFSTEAHSFNDIAERLGFTRLNKSDEAIENRSTLVAFFHAVCKAPNVNGEMPAHWSEGQWKMINRNQETELRSAWMEVCDDDFNSSRKCSENDWTGLLKAPQEIVFEVRSHNGRVMVRFRDLKKTKFNKDLL